MQKVDPPSQVIDAFRDVQAARADLERAQNEAQTYANRVVPEARGRAAQITQAAEAYREQTVAEAKGADRRASSRSTTNTRRRPTSPASACISRPWNGCSAAPTRSSSTAGAAAGGVVPYLPLDQLHGGRSSNAQPQTGGAPMRLNLAGGIVAALVVVALIVAYGSLFTVYQTRQALVVRLGQPVRVVTEPGLHFKIPLIDSVIHIDKRILDLENPAQEVIASDQKRLVVDAFARYKITDPLKFYQTVGSVEGANSRLSTLLNSALRRVLGEATLTHVVRDERAAADGAGARAARHRGAGLRHRHRRRAHSPRRPAGAEQPGGLSAHADRAPARSAGIPRPGQPARAGDPRQGRSRRHRAARRRTVDGEQIRGEGDAERNRIFAEAFGRDPEFFAFYRSMQAYEAGLRSSDTRMLLKPDSEFFRYLRRSVGQAARPVRMPAGTRSGRDSELAVDLRHHASVTSKSLCADDANVGPGTSGRAQDGPSSSLRSVWCSSSRGCSSRPFQARRNGWRRARWRARKRRCGSRASCPPCSASC